MKKEDKTATRTTAGGLTGTPPARPSVKDYPGGAKADVGGGHETRETADMNKTETGSRVRPTKIS